MFLHPLSACFSQERSLVAPTHVGLLRVTPRRQHKLDINESLVMCSCVCVLRSAAPQRSHVQTCCVSIPHASVYHYVLTSAIFLLCVCVCPQVCSLAPPARADLLRVHPTKFRSLKPPTTSTHLLLCVFVPTGTQPGATHACRPAACAPHKV